MLYSCTTNHNTQHKKIHESEKQKDKKGIKMIESKTNRTCVLKEHVDQSTYVTTSMLNPKQ